MLDLWYFHWFLIHRLTKTEELMVLVYLYLPVLLWSAKKRSVNLLTLSVVKCIPHVCIQALQFQSYPFVAINENPEESSYKFDL